MQHASTCQTILEQSQLLLADVPITSLDPLSANIVMQQLNKISKQNLQTCIVNLHQGDWLHI